MKSHRDRFSGPVLKRAKGPVPLALYFILIDLPRKNTFSPKVNIWYHDFITIREDTS
jgi:hypothetical protein